jgi:uncharacterized protein (DUF427 family)
MIAPGRVEPGAGQESVWDYPRPPGVEPVPERIRVVVDGVVIAASERARRVLETSHPPAYYIPAADVREDLLEPTPTSTVCEFKGRASYVTLRVPETGRTIADVAWVYRSPTPEFEAIRDHYAFYPGRVDEAWVGDERARAQAGSFYGGWITDRIVGPFKGEVGTRDW